MVKIFRGIFILFSLYLMGDAFSRWDGARHYASISDFLPSVCLVFILWTVVALLVSTAMYTAYRVIGLANRNFKVDHFLTFILCFALGAALLYLGRPFLKNIDITAAVKLILLIIILSGSALATWLLRNLSEKVFNTINERISPLVWAFSFLLLISVPVVAYKALSTDRKTAPSVPPGDVIETTAHKKTNILFVTFDALTARNMSAYSYERPTTPFIDAWADSATLFSHLKAESTYTTPTTSSLMTGKRVWTHQTYFVEVASQYVSMNNENIPYLLKKHGYTNLALQQIHQASVEKLGLADSFDIIYRPEKLAHSSTLYQHLDDFLYNLFGEKIIIYDWIIKEDFILSLFLHKISSDSSVTDQRPETAFNKFLEILDNGLTEPYFAWIHLYAPHDPYLPPRPFKGKFNPSDELTTWKSQNASKNQRKLDIFRDRYDEFISYGDKHFENFVHDLEKRNALDNTVLILSSDHGEIFGRNYRGHGGPHLFEELVHIPLIIKEPGQTDGRVVDDISEQIDITPTILEMAGIEIPSWIEGRSLMPLIRGESLEPKPAFSMTLHGNLSRGHEINNGTVSVWDDGYKLIHYLQNDTSLLYNLTNDPNERVNLITREPDIGERLLNLMRDHLKAANERIIESARSETSEQPSR